MAIEANQALVNLTYSPGGVSRNVDLPDAVALDSTDAQVLAIVTEAVRTGGFPGIPADPRADFSRDFVVDRVDPSEQYPYTRFMVRPKVPFGTRS
jgi:hypothetical protein